MQRLIIVTGGTGYIGSHICAKALKSGMLVASLDIEDRLSVHNAMYIMAPEKFEFNYKFLRVDLKDDITLSSAMSSVYSFFEGRYSSVTLIHCAAYKSVGESVSNPLKYYDNNLLTTINILKNLDKVSCFILSSSACVYGHNPNRVKPYIYRVNDEDVGRYITNPYGRTKYFEEEIIKDMANVKKNTTFVILRYFNPIYSHPLLPEDRMSPNLFPQIMNSIETDVPLKIFGCDYPTRDGTCIRDYINVMDVADKHLENFGRVPNLVIKNIGTEKGMTVLELVKEVENSFGIEIEKEFVGRRVGDVAEILSVIN